MENQNMGTACSFHSLITLADFKEILGIDDQDDALSRYCLVTATYSIEQYCRRRLFISKQTEIHEYARENEVFPGVPQIPLKQYPVRKILGAQKYRYWKSIEEIDPELFRCIPECGVGEDIPFCLEIRPDVTMPPCSVRVRYVAGYKSTDAPADLASACLEMAVWNMARFRGRRIGVVGGSVTVGKKTNGEYLEAHMPERVKELLEPYQRRMI
ncbi:phage head-tail connector protein [Treponema primitia]|uniref:hypothetical protein n=1 Tax=Treponema primitia TaxID=88058 RepID=UPI0039816F58